MSLRSLFILPFMVPGLCQADSTLTYASETPPGSETIIQVKIRGVLIVIETQERAAVHSIDTHRPEDIGIVAHDDIGIPTVAGVRRDRAIVAKGIDLGIAGEPVRITGATVHQVRPIRAHIIGVNTENCGGIRIEAEQVGTAADHVILTEIAVHAVVAAVTFHIIIAVGGLLSHIEHQIFKSPIDQHEPDIGHDE